MNPKDRTNLINALHSYNNVGDMIKHIYVQYDTSKPLNIVHKNLVINALVSAVTLLGLKKYSE